MAVGIQEEFEYHFTPDEANSIRDIKETDLEILKSKGIKFD